jgi:glutamate carboxypeptidase
LHSSLDVPQLLKEVRRREASMIDRMKTLVEIESPSGSKDAVDHVQSIFGDWAHASAGKVRRHAQQDFGDSLEVIFAQKQRREKSVMLLGHLDTVWELGTLANMPWHLTRDRISGPGVLDMKAGVVMALTAVEILKDLQLLDCPVTLLIHGDEEVGSPASRRLTEAVALRSRAVFVLEPAHGDRGAYKTARKAVGMYRLTVKGIAAHSGVDFELGHSAVVELARQIERLHSLIDLSNGITVNPGVIGGGTRSNVVAADARVMVDVRIARKRDVARLDRAIRRLTPFDKACELTVNGGLNRPPMERTAATVALFRRAQKFASQMGLALEEAATGGGSDGNFTSGLGVPTLDGMGAVGLGAHAPHEHLVRRHMAQRTALLVAMLAETGSTVQ